jgi:hypothetical protein
MVKFSELKRVRGSELCNSEGYPRLSFFSAFKTFNSVVFDCPICGLNPIEIRFYNTFVTDCKKKRINPLIPIVCEHCQGKMLTNPEFIEEAAKKLGWV